MSHNDNATDETEQYDYLKEWDTGRLKYKSQELTHDIAEKEALLEAVESEIEQRDDTEQEP